MREAGDIQARRRTEVRPIVELLGCPHAMEHSETGDAGAGHGEEGGNPSSRGNKHRRPRRPLKNKVAVRAGESQAGADVCGGEKGRNEPCRHIADTETEARGIGARQERVVSLQASVEEANPLPGSKLEGGRPAQLYLEALLRQPRSPEEPGGKGAGERVSGGGDGHFCHTLSVIP